MFYRWIMRLSSYFNKQVLLWFQYSAKDFLLAALWLVHVIFTKNSNVLWKEQWLCHCGPAEARSIFCWKWIQTLISNGQKGL